MATEEKKEKTPEQLRDEYRTRRDRIDGHRNDFNALSASVLAMGDNAWDETQKYARPAEMLESVYTLKKTIEPFGRYEDITNGPIFELTQLMNAFCAKWHAILFYPLTSPRDMRDNKWDENLFAENAYAPHSDDALRLLDEALRQQEGIEGHGQITFNDEAFIGKGLIQPFWKEVGYVRNRANAARLVILAELQRLQALNRELEATHDVW